MAETGRNANEALQCIQVAFSTLDRERTVAWYTDGLGYLRAGSLQSTPDLPLAELMGLPECECRIEWLVDSQEFFQLEVFSFTRPEPRPRPDDWSPADVGYTTVTFHVDDLDGTLERLRGLGTSPLGEPLGPAGERRVCVKDPDGVVVELMEADFRRGDGRLRAGPRIPVAARAVRASVPDLERSLRFFAGTLGMERSDRDLHGPEHEALWGLDGAAADAATLWSGDFAVELVQYRDPVGRGWPEGYLISDQGLVNIALGSHDPGSYEAAIAAVDRAGYAKNRELVHESAVNYVTDDQGFGAELLWLTSAGERAFGFVPLEAGER